MLIIKLILIYVLALKFRSVYGQMACSDCLFYKQCQNVPTNLENNPLSEHVEKIFIDTYCDFEMGTIIKTKVCCYEFTKKLLDLDYIETHPNINLLPTDCLPVAENPLAKNWKKFPWMAILMSSKKPGEFYCEGTIINSKYILTASHCIRQEKELLKIRVGDYDLNSTSKFHIQDISIEEVLLHEEFRFSPAVHDIALLRLKEPIDLLFVNIAPVCLPVAKELRTPLTDGKLGVVTGWRFFELMRAATKLQKVEVPVITKETCDNRFYSNRKSPVGVLEFCLRDGYNECISSGGPLLIEKKWKNEIVYIQYGISSRGPKNCSDTKSPEMFTNVIGYMKWILDHIKP